MATEKQHYRNVFKSDHLGSADLEDFKEQGSNLIFSIKEVRQEFGVKVAGKKGDFNVAYFNEKIKPLVLNVTNSKVIQSFVRTTAFPKGSPFVQDWKNVVVELYIDENVKAVSGGTTQGVRIRPVQPVLQKPKPVFTASNFESAKAKNVSREVIEKHYLLTDEVYQQFLDYGTKE